MKNEELLKGLSIEELQERNEFSTLAVTETETSCCDHFDPTPPCCGFNE
jgi:hypothetical protein